MHKKEADEGLQSMNRNPNNCKACPKLFLLLGNSLLESTARNS